MPQSLSPPQLFCAALYTLTGGKPKGLMVATMADWLGITFEAAEALAEKCAERGWLEYVSHTVALRSPGLEVARKVLDATATAPDRRPPGRRQLSS